MRSLALPLALALFACSSTRYTLATDPPTALEVDGWFGERQTADLLSAYATTVGILRDPVFLQYLGNKDDLATSATTQCQWISPLALARTLNQYIDQGAPLRADRYLNYPARWCSGTTAKTGQCAATKIFASIVEQWDESQARPRLINTIAHEMTHLLPVPDGESHQLDCSANAQQYILDDGYTRCESADKACNEASLASYAFGDLVQCFFENQTDVTRADECYETTLNMEKPDWFRRSAATKSAPLKCTPSVAAATP